MTNSNPNIRTAIIIIIHKRSGFNGKNRYFYGIFRHLYYTCPERICQAVRLKTPTFPHNVSKSLDRVKNVWYYIMDKNIADKAPQLFDIRHRTVAECIYLYRINFQIYT